MVNLFGGEDLLFCLLTLGRIAEAFIISLKTLKDSHSYLGPRQLLTIKIELFNFLKEIIL